MQLIIGRPPGCVAPAPPWLPLAAAQGRPSGCGQAAARSSRRRRVDEAGATNMGFAVIYCYGCASCELRVARGELQAASCEPVGRLNAPSCLHLPAGAPTQRVHVRRSCDSSAALIVTLAPAARGAAFIIGPPAPISAHLTLLAAANRRLMLGRQVSSNFRRRRRRPFEHSSR